MNKRRSFRALVAVLVVSALTACTGTGNTTPDSEGNGAPVVFALSTDVDVLDPQQFRNDTSYIVTAAMSGTLITEAFTDKSGVLEATGEYRSSIAEYPPSISNDAKTVKFELNQGAEFEDGSTITADDWVYTWRRIFEGPGYLAALLPLIGIESPESVYAEDEDTLVIERAFDSPMFMPFMASPCCFGVMSESAGEENATEEDPWAGKWFANNPVSSGPLKVTSWRKGQEIVLEPNPGHPDAEMVKTPRVILKVVPSQEDRIALISQGAVDVALDLPAREVARLEEEPQVDVHSFDGRRVHHLGFSLTTEPFTDAKLREAVTYAVPYETLVDEVLFGYGQEVHSVVSKGMPGYEDVFPVQQDLDRARQLLAESDYDGSTLPLAVRQSQPLDQAAAIIVQDTLREIGLNVQIDTLPDASFQEQLGERKLPFFISDWQSLGNDGFYQLSWVAQSESPINYTGFSSERVDEIIAAGVPEADETRRADLVLEASQLFAEDTPWVPLFQPANIVVTSAGLQGVNNFYDPLRRIEFLHKGE